MPGFLNEDTFLTWQPCLLQVEGEKIWYNIRVVEVWMDKFKYLFYDRLVQGYDDTKPCVISHHINFICLY